MAGKLVIVRFAYAFIYCIDVFLWGFLLILRIFFFFGGERESKNKSKCQGCMGWYSNGNW
jgi:hypothetical protein